MKYLIVMNFSGGIDSTAALWSMLKKFSHRDNAYNHYEILLCYNSLKNNEKKMLKEKFSVCMTDERLRKWLKDEKIENIKILNPSTNLELELGGVHNVTSQPLLWATLLPFHLGYNKFIVSRDNYEEYDRVIVASGYIHGDDYWHFRSEVESIIRNSVSFLAFTSNLQIDEFRKKIVFLYPLEWDTKEDVLSYYEAPVLSEFREWVWTCENPTSCYEPCLNCKPCTTLLKISSTFLKGYDKLAKNDVISCGGPINNFTLDFVVADSNDPTSDESTEVEIKEKTVHE